MEEKEKLNEQPQKLTYEELNDALADVTTNYNKLMGKYREAVNALNQFDFTAFFLDKLFRVLEHPNRYDEKFVRWCTENIQAAMYGFAAQKEKEMEEDKKDEAK